VKSLNGTFVVIAPHEVVPFGNEVTQRATLVAERHATVHATTGLSGQSSRISRLVNLFPVFDAQRNGASLTNLTLAGVQKSFGISHRSPP
jgi:hypothetical protein